MARLDGKGTADLNGATDAARDDGLAGMLGFIDRSHQRGEANFVAPIDPAKSKGYLVRVGRRHWIESSERYSHIPDE